MLCCFLILGAVTEGQTPNRIPSRIRYGMSSRYFYPSGITRITFDPQDVLQCAIPDKKLETGSYDLYVRVAPDGDPAPMRLFDIGLADAVSYVYYKPPAGPQWIGPIHFKTSYPTDRIDLHGSGYVWIDCYRIVPAGTPLPEKGEKAIPSLEQKDWKTVLLDWPTYPAWVTDQMPVTIRVRTAGSGEAKINCRIFDFDRKEVGNYPFTVLLEGKERMETIPVPKRFGPYLLRFFVTLPGVKEFEMQRVVTRVSSPLEFAGDRLAGHGNYPLLKMMGAGWNRLWDCGGGNTQWDGVEPEQGKFVWDDVLAPAPIRSTAVLERSPAWNKKDRYEDSSGWLNYVRQTVTHYRGKIPVYEIFNEPYNSHALTKEFPRRHAALVKATAKVIRECDPKALVMSGGPPEEIPPGLGWWEGVAREGMLEPLDIITAHLYFGGGGTHPLDQDVRFDAYVTSLRKLVDTYGGKGKPIWDTESGFCPMESFYIDRQKVYGSWGGDGLTEREPVSYPVAAAMAGRFLLLHFWHNMRWSYYHTTGACYGNSWSLCDYDETPLPAAGVMAQLTRLFDRAQADGKPSLPDGLWGVRFKDGKNCLVAFWSVFLSPGEKRSIGYPGGAGVKVLDMFCNPIEKTDRINVGMSPVILTGSPEAIAKALAAMKVKREIDGSSVNQRKISTRLTAMDFKPPAVLSASSTAAGYQPDMVRDENPISSGGPKDSWSSNLSGLEQWLEYRWQSPQTIHRIVCAWPPADIPAQYKIEWHDGAVWHPCSGTPDWRNVGVTHEDYTIDAVKTTRLRMVIRSKAGKPAKVSEFDAYYIPRLTPPVLEMQEIWSKEFKPSTDGFIRDWLVCGPFPSPGLRYTVGNKPKNWDEDLLDTCWIYSFGHGEPVIKPTVDREHVASFPAGTLARWKPMDVRVAWQPVHVGAENYLDMGKQFINDLLVKPGQIVEQCFGYAACYLNVPADMDATLAIGSDDGYKIWLDEKIVAEKIVFRGAGQDQEKYPVKLAKGKHRLLVKVHNDIGGHGIFLRFLDKKDKPVTNIIVKLAP